MSADRKPPRSAGSEADVLVSLLDFQRDSLRTKLVGLTAEQLNWSPVPSGTSLIWLVAHLARAEQIWVLERFAGAQRVIDVNEHEGAERVLSAHRRVGDAVNDVVAHHDLEERCADPDYSDTTLRWVMAHLLEETARHAGHADILRELIDGATGR